MDKENIISTFEKIISVCKEDGCDFVDLSFEDAEQILSMLKEQEVKEQISDAIHETAKQFRKTIVRCKDCKWRGTNACFCKSKDDVKDNWFCSEGQL
jgi:hypothetical protein